MSANDTTPSLRDDRARSPRFSQEFASALGDDHPSGKTKQRAVVDPWIELAFDGSMSAISALVERIDGKVSATAGAPEDRARIIFEWKPGNA
jgi:hypothetical protein